ncbi:MAG TPA: TraB/GumN family protein [Rhodanobacteraceae bacterium]|nr:TraB/GumN family protein [Rhodanobacteraceae bacterium]
MPKPTILLSACFLAAAAAASAGAPPAANMAHPAPAASITTLQAITVTGVVPGPGLWKVTHGAHVLWILGVPRALPAAVQWQSAEVANTVAASQAVLELPDVKFKLDTSWFGKVFLIPAALGAIHNPDGKTLKDVLPSALYARWSAARQRYYGNDHALERDRPLFAAGKLMKKAMRVNGLHGTGQITGKVAELAKQHGVALIDPDTRVEIRQPHRALKELAASGPLGTACMGMVLDTVEYRLPAVRAGANAWATGDLAALRRLPQSAYRDSCESVFSDPAVVKALGVDNLPRRREDTWLAAAQDALATNAQTFALLPMDDLLDAHGYLAALAARGYTITPPDAGSDDPAGAASTGEPAPAGSAH